MRNFMLFFFDVMFRTRKPGKNEDTVPVLDDVPDYIKGETQRHTTSSDILEKRIKEFISESNRLRRQIHAQRED
jgi:hypothetical protein